MIQISDSIDSDSQKTSKFDVIKQLIFKINHNTLHFIKGNSLLYKFFYFVGYLQLLYFSISPRTPKMWTMNFIVYLRTLCQYFQMEQNMTGMNDDTWIGAIVLILCLIILLVLMVTYMAIKLHNKKDATGGLFDVINVVSSFLLMLYQTILIVPISQYIFVGYFCKNNDFSNNFICNDTNNSIKILLSTITLIVHMAIILYLGLFFFDPNPFSGGPFSGIRSQYRFSLMGAKFIIPLLFIVTQDNTFSQTAVAIILAIHLLLFFMIVNSPPLVDKSMNTLRIIFQNALWWVTLCVLVQILLDTGEIDNLGVLYCALGIIFTTVITMNHNNNVCARILAKKIFRDTTEMQVIQFSYAYIDLAEKSADKIQRAIFHASLRNVFKNLHGFNEALFEEAKEILICKFESPKQYQKLCYTFLNNFLERFSQTFPKSAYIKMLIGFINHMKLNLVWMSLYRMQVLDNCNPGIQLSFASTSQMIQIENELRENELRKRENTGLDIAYIMNFNAKYFQLMDQISQSVDLHHKFWTELNQSQPSIPKLQGIGKSITSNLEQFKATYKSINHMNTNHFRTLNLYGNFTKYVLNDKEESQKLLSKANYIAKSTGLGMGQLNSNFQDIRIKYSENSDFGIILASGNDQNIGQIKGFNYKVMTRFGYSHDELANQNLDILMPKIIAEKHDFLMRRYFFRNQKSVMGFERSIFGMDRNGFIFPTNLLIKVVPNLDMNLRIVGLMTPNTEEFDKNNQDNLDIDHIIMYHTTEGTVYGVSKGCYYEFGIRPDIVYGKTRSSNVLNLTDVFPKIGDLSNLKNKNSLDSLKTILDTSNIVQRFYSDKTDFVKIGPPRQGKEAFDVYDVKFEVSDNTKYGLEDLNITILKFKVIKGKQIQQLGNMIGNYTKGKRQKIDNMMKEFEETEDQEEEIKALLNKENEQKKKEEAQGNQMNRYRKDVETNTADRERKIKEKKVSLAEKRVPRSITIFKILIALVFLLTVGISSFGLYWRTIVNNYKSEGDLAMQQQSIKSALIADVGYDVLMVQLWAEDRLNSFIEQDITGLKSKIEQRLNGLKMSQHFYNNALIIFEDNGYVTILKLSNFANIKQLLSDTDVSSKLIPKLAIMNLDESIYETLIPYITLHSQFINEANIVEIAPKALLKSTSPKNEYQLALFYILNNSSTNYRLTNEIKRLVVWQSVLELNDKFKRDYVLKLILNILSVVIPFACLFPFIVKLNNGMNKIMSLFATISTDQLNSLINRCDKFKNNYLLENQKLKENGGDINYKDFFTDQSSIFDFISKAESSVALDDDQSSEKSLKKVLRPEKAGKHNQSDHSLSYEGDESLNQSYVKDKIDKEMEKLKNFNPEDATPKKKDNELKITDSLEKTPQFLSATPLKTKTNLALDLKSNFGEDELSDQEQKALTLASFKEKFTQFYLFKAVISTVLIVTLVVLDYINSISFLNNRHKAGFHMFNLGDMNVNLKFLNLFTLMSVAEKQAIKQEENDMVEYFGELVYEKMNILNRDLKDTFHSSLDSYQSIYTKISNENICENLFKTQSQYNFTNCDSDEFFTKGLQTLLVKVAEDCRIVSRENLQITTSTPTSVLNIGIQAKLKSIDDYAKKLGMVLEHLLIELIASFKTMTSLYILLEILIFIGMLLVVFLLYNLVWMPFITMLQARTWIAQSMVNMIPFEIIAENKMLQKQVNKAYFGQLST